MKEYMLNILDHGYNQELEDCLEDISARLQRSENRELFQTWAATNEIGLEYSHGSYHAVDCIKKLI